MTWMIPKTTPRNPSGNGASNRATRVPSDGITPICRSVRNSPNCLPSNVSALAVANPCCPAATRKIRSKSRSRCRLPPGDSAAAVPADLHLRTARSPSPPPPRSQADSQRTIRHLGVGRDPPGQVFQLSAHGTLDGARGGSWVWTWHRAPSPTACSGWKSCCRPIYEALEERNPRETCIKPMRRGGECSSSWKASRGTAGGCGSCWGRTR